MDQEEIASPTMRIWAIIGTGPSLADVRDWHHLTSERRVLVINGAIDLDLQPDVALLFDNLAAIKWFGKIHPPTELAISSHLLEWGSGMEWAWQERVRGYKPLSVFEGTLGGSLPQALKFLAQHKTPEAIELYGIDLDTSAYTNQIRSAADIILRWGLGVTNCCPSTKSDLVPIEGRPWTR